MRKLLTLGLALGLFLAVPVGVASAQDQIKLAMRVQETSAGFDETGTAYAEGSYQVFADGVVVEQGTVSSVYHTVDGSFVYGYRTYTNPATGDYIMVSGRWHLTKTNGTLFVYDGNQEITATNTGIVKAHIGEHVKVKGSEDGSFVLSGLSKWIVEF